MGPETSPTHPKGNLHLLAIELRELRDLLGTLSLQLCDIQFESDAALRARAVAETDQLLKSCQSQVT